MVDVPLLIAVVVFLITYILIIDERIHRAVAAMAGAAVVVFLGIVPWDSLLEHLDLGTIFLLMGMMIIINTARNSGLFEYIAIVTAKKARGSPIMVLILFALVNRCDERVPGQRDHRAPAHTDAALHRKGDEPEPHPLPADDDPRIQCGAAQARSSATPRTS